MWNPPPASGSLHPQPAAAVSSSEDVCMRYRAWCWWWVDGAAASVLVLMSAVSVMPRLQGEFIFLQPLSKGSRRCGCELLKVVASHFQFFSIRDFSITDWVQVIDQLNAFSSEEPVGDVWFLKKLVYLLHYFVSWCDQAKCPNRD